MSSNKKRFWILKAVTMQTPFIIGADDGSMSKADLAITLAKNPDFANYPYRVVEEISAKDLSFETND